MFVLGCCLVRYSYCLATRLLEVGGTILVNEGAVYTSFPCIPGIDIAFFDQ